VTAHQRLEAGLVTALGPLDQGGVVKVLQSRSWQADKALGLLWRHCAQASQAVTNLFARAQEAAGVYGQSRCKSDVLRAPNPSTKTSATHRL